MSHFVARFDAETSMKQRPVASVCGWPGRHVCVPITTHTSAIGPRVRWSTTMITSRAKPARRGAAVIVGRGVGLDVPGPFPGPCPPPFPPPPPPPPPPGPVLPLAPDVPGTLDASAPLVLAGDGDASSLGAGVGDGGSVSDTTTTSAGAPTV